MIEATEKQKRAIVWLNRRYPDTVGPLVAERGGSSQSLEGRGQRDSGCRSRRSTRGRREEAGDARSSETSTSRSSGDQQQNCTTCRTRRRTTTTRRSTSERMRRSGFRPGSKQEYIANALRDNDMDADKTRRGARRTRSANDSDPHVHAERQRQPRRCRWRSGRSPTTRRPQTQHGVRSRRSSPCVARCWPVASRRASGRRSRSTSSRRSRRKARRPQATVRPSSYLAWIRQVRKYCQDKAADGHPLDEIGLRPVEYGAALLSSGIPLAAIKHAVTMHYPPEARRALGVRDYDVQDVPHGGSRWMASTRRCRTAWRS